MSFAQKYFNKSLENITEEDVLMFFSRGQHEGQHLEFKSGEVQMVKILKEISAFLNAGGGLVVVGAPREVEVRGEADRASKGQPVPSTIYSLEEFSRQVFRGIEPRPVGIGLHQIRISGGSIFLADVPPSPQPPHQVAVTGKYYIREGATSRPAQHRELEKMFLESRKALLDLQIELERPADDVIVRLIIENKSTASAVEPALVLTALPVRQAGEQQEQRILKDNYLARGQRWVQEITVLPRNPRFFISCQYYCRHVDVKLKAAFAEIQHHKIQILKVFNSEVHTDFQLWYNRYSYLLDE